MGDVIDTGRRPRGERGATALVEAVVRAGDLAEDHHLEIKSGIDLSSKLGRAKVAKFILGAANRMPDLARAHFEGAGVMILGIEKNGRPGVEPIEMLTLRQGLDPYLGPDGPEWEVLRAPADEPGREVLLIVVDAPVAGQPPFLCHRSYQSDIRSMAKHNVRDGAVYVRRRGETSEANAAELRRLLERATFPSQPAEVRIGVSGTALRYTADTSVLEAWIDRTGDELLDDFSKAQRASESLAAKGLQGIGGMSSVRGIRDILSTPEDRSVDQFRREVAHWREACRKRIPAVLDRVAAAKWSPVSFRIINQSTVFLEAVEVELHIDGDVIARKSQRLPKNAGYSDLFPPPPRKWGPRLHDAWGGMQVPISPLPAVNGLALSNRPRWARFENGGSVTVTFGLDEVRPRQQLDLDDQLSIVLLARDPVLHDLVATWKMTAKGHHELYEGALRVAIADRALGSL